MLTRSADIQYMRSAAQRRRPTVPLFAVYSFASLVPVAVLGALLAMTYRADTNGSAMAEARSQAALLSDDVVGPQLGTAALQDTIPPSAQLRSPPYSPARLGSTGCCVCASVTWRATSCGRTTVVAAVP